jgi:hypothetical protein
MSIQILLSTPNGGVFMSNSIVTLLDELGFAEAAQRGDERRPELLRRLAALRDPDAVAARLHRDASRRPSRAHPAPPALNPRAAPRRSGFGEADDETQIAHPTLRAYTMLELLGEVLEDPDVDPGTQLGVTRWCSPLHFGATRAGNQLRALRRLAPPRPGHALRALRALTPRLEAMGAAQLVEIDALLACASAPEGRAVLGDERPERFVASVVTTRAWWWYEARGYASLCARFSRNAHPGHDYVDDPTPWERDPPAPFESHVAHLRGRGRVTPALAALLLGLVPPPSPPHAFSSTMR